MAHVDLTVVAQSVGWHHIAAMRRSFAEVLGVAEEVVSVKATTTDHMGSIGRDEGVAAVAVVTWCNPMPSTR